MEAGIALNCGAADDIQDIDQADLSQAIDLHPALGIELPFIVGLEISGRCGRRQIAMVRIAPRQLGMFKQRGNP